MRMGILTLLLLATPVHALNEGLQCVPYARALTGVEIRGDAHSWWGQADGRYQRGTAPKVGAVMSFRPHGNMRLGHVAAVRKIIDKRTLIISHANWSTINGGRGHIEDDVRVVDASEANDWSRVRVWYTPNAALGTTEWPLNGFIYPAKARSWGEGKQAVVSLLGHAPKGVAKPAATVAVAKLPVKSPAKPAIQAAVVSSKPKANFSLSPSLLAEIEKGAAKDRKARAAKR
ncbi:MAG: CHAP domain-containing protein [Sphingorhabdus sp.]